MVVAQRPGSCKRYLRDIIFLVDVCKLMPDALFAFGQASALAFTVYNLAKHPENTAKLLQVPIHSTKCCSACNHDYFLTCTSHLLQYLCLFDLSALSL